MANCERLDKKYLKTVLELPENNFEKNFSKTKIVDRFINDLQDKLRKFKLKKTSDSKDALKIIMKVKNEFPWYEAVERPLSPGFEFVEPWFTTIYDSYISEFLTSRRLFQFKNIFKILKKVSGDEYDNSSIAARSS